MKSVLGLVALASASVAASPSIQQQFNSANAALDRRDFAAALAGFEAIERQPTLSPRTRSLVMLRAGEALYQLRRIDEAQASLRQGLEGVPKDDPSLAAYRLSAMDVIGAIEEDRLDLASAAKAYAELVAAYDADVASAASWRERDGARAMKRFATEQQIRATIFVDTGKAIELADKALIAAQQERQPATTLAELHRLRGVALMNAEQHDAARESLLTAFGLDRASPAIGSDLALLGRLAPGSDKQPKTLTYRLDLPAKYYPSTQSAPPCGKAGMSERDFGVVQLQIADDGTPFNVKPIYSSAGTAAAILFAHAVTTWRWPTQQPTPTVPQFYRLGSRVELHCHR